MKKVYEYYLGLTNVILRFAFIGLIKFLLYTVPLAISFGFGFAITREIDQVFPTSLQPNIFGLVLPGLMFGILIYYFFMGMVRQNYFF